MPKRQRIETSPNSKPLTSNPFSELNASPTSESEIREPTEEKPAKLPFTVPRTRKGNFPVFVEKRGGGKKVTLVRGVQGDAAALLRLLQKKLSSGGTTKGDVVEIQGDHSEVVAIILHELGMR